MGLRFPEGINGTCFFVTTSFRDHVPFGNTPGVYEVIVRSIEFCLEKYSALLPGYVIMPTHLHILLVIHGKQLGNFMRDFKKFVAQKEFVRLGITTDTVWQERYDRVAVYSERVFRTKLEYIHKNPVKAGLVAEQQEWQWSSAGKYILGLSGPLPIWTDWS
jgi:REP element-mobilizing transposase RayT